MVRGVLVDPERADQLWEAFAAKRDLEGRNALVELYLPWCRVIARAAYARRGGLAAEYLEYVQLATLGLIEAIDHYDRVKDVSFEAYAHTRVRGAIFNGLRSLTEKHEQVSLQRRLRMQRLKSLSEKSSGERANEDLFERLARVTVGFAIGYMLEGTNMVLDITTILHPRREFYDSVELRERRDIIKGLVDRLPVQERRVLQYHYYQGLAFTDIAELMDLSKGRVSQVHRSALEHLRELAKAMNVTFTA